jgi:dipeptidyl aminopeptidase/acylaminoacyl peptidase
MKAKVSALCLAIALSSPQAFSLAENLVVEGIPTPPATMIDGVNRYTEFRSADFDSWHPTERQMLIGTRFADTKQVHLVKFPGAARTQLTFFKDSATSGSFQPTAGNFMVFSKDVGGDENFQKYKYTMSDYGVSLITDGKSRNTGGVWSHSGLQYAYGSTKRNGDDVDIWTVNPHENGSNRMVAELKGGGWDVLDWSPNDQEILAQEELSANESYLWLIDVKTGSKTLITPKGGSEKVYYGGAKFSKDGKGIFTACDKNNDFSRLTYIDLSTKVHTYLSDKIKWDVEGFDLTEDGKYIAFVTNEDGISILHVLDLETKQEKDIPKLAPGVISSVKWHKNSKDLAFTYENARSPEDIYSYNLQDNKIERWTTSETGGIDTSNFSQPELVKWKTFDDKSISGFLYRPQAKFTGKRPVVINIHGGPEGQFRPYFLGKTNYYLNELGIAILFPNVRGSVGYGKTFLAMDNGFRREDSYKDIKALLDWIKTQPELDSDRVMVMGGSYGGFMTLACATNYNDHIRCALDIVGPSNLVTFLKNTSGYRRDLRRVEYGDERDPKMNEFLERIAPANHSSKIKKPLFVVQGKNDPRVPASESEQMVANVRKNQTPVWYLMANDEGHGFAKKKNSDYLFYSTILFMEKYLLN